MASMDKNTQWKPKSSHNAEEYLIQEISTTSPPDPSNLMSKDSTKITEPPKVSIDTIQTTDSPAWAEKFDMESILDDKFYPQPELHNGVHKDNVVVTGDRMNQDEHDLKPLMQTEIQDITDLLNTDDGVLFTDDGAGNNRTVFSDTEDVHEDFHEDYRYPSNEENNAWMDQNMDFEEEDATAAFAEHKINYQEKRESGITTLEEDVHFMQAESAENSRQKRLRSDHEWPHHKATLDQNGDLHSDGELFISSEPPLRKRNNEEMIGNDNNEEYFVTPRGFDLENMSELERSMVVGIEELLSKGQKQEAKKAKKAGGQKNRAKSPDKGKSRVNKASRKPRAINPAPKSKSKPKSRAKARPNQPGYLSNIDSLLTSNVFEDANANIDLSALPVVASKNKDEFLKNLLAGVPLEDKKAIRGEKTHILRATRILGNTSSDGEGHWKMKGMRSSLHHHQVEGAAWMRSRELGDIEPHGGLQADTMGLGKTLMALALMVANRPSHDEHKPTLIVCPSSIVSQWWAEIEKHVEKKIFPRIFRFQASSVESILGPDFQSALEDNDVILTTYQEVMASYPRFKPPKEVVDFKSWWATEFETKRGTLHRITFHRIILDEAHAIKNFRSQTSIACRGLMASYRWAMTGTPIHNAVAEFYPYFKFLRIRNTGTLQTFIENYCEPDDEDDTARLHSILTQIMIRRTHKNKFLGKPIIKLPKSTQTTFTIEFNKVERTIYESVRIQYIKCINGYSKNGQLDKAYKSVLTMLLRLRQLTAHPFMLQDVISDIFDLEDIEKLWNSTRSEVSTEKDPARDMLSTMKKMIEDKVNQISNDANDPNADMPTMPFDKPIEDDPDENSPLLFKFRKYLRELAASSKWAALRDRSLCHSCDDPLPDDPWVTSCMHVYCKECLSAMTYEAAKNGEAAASCKECGTVFTESTPCSVVEELELNPDLNQKEKARRKRKDSDSDMRWIDMNGKILPSSKTAAVQAQIEHWLKAEPEKKIILFCQFHILMKVLGKVCIEQGWGYCNLNGNMSHKARDKAIAQFAQNPSTKILIASLKCGGVGLNLTMASRVICVDLWWNSSVEQQAFCRIFRLGQASETQIVRLIVRNTVDEKLQDLQDRKSVAIQEAIDDPRMLEGRSVTELMRLFGTVREDEDHKPFILVEEGEYGEGLMPDSDDPGGFFGRGRG